MNLLEYSTIVKEILEGKPGKTSANFIKNLKKDDVKSFRFSIAGKNIVIKSEIYPLDAIFVILNKISQQKDYELFLKALSKGKIKTLNGKFKSNEKIELAKKELTEGEVIDRIYYETIKTEDFEITYSEFEGAVIKTKGEEFSKEYFRLLLGLFPFIDFEKDTKDVEVKCTFEIKKLDVKKRGFENLGNLKCEIKVNGKAAGVRQNSFLF